MLLMEGMLDRKATLSNLKAQIKELSKELNENVKITVDIDGLRRDIVGAFRTVREDTAKLIADIEKEASKTEAKVTIKTELDHSAHERAIEKYKAGIDKLNHEMKLGMITQSEYINAMQQAVYSPDGFTKEFKALDAKDQERAVRNINTAIAQRDRVLNQNIRTQQALNREIEKEENLYQKIATRKSGLGDIASTSSRFDLEEYNRLSKAFDDVEASVRRGSMSVKEGENALKKLTPEVRSFATESKKASESSDRMAARIKDFVGFNLVTQVMRTGKRVMKEMVVEVKALDSSLIELQKVTDISGEALNSFTKRSFRLGETLSRTGKEVIDAVSVFSRAGYQLEESMTLAQDALIMTNVADGIDSVEESSSALIAVMKGYNKEVDDAIDIVDAFNEVSNTQAVNYFQLAEASTRLSGVMRQQGVEFEQMLGLITGGTEVLRDHLRVATGLQTISLRLGGLDEATGEQDVELVAKLGKKFKEMANIDLTDAQGQMRGTYDILKDMAEIFPTLKKNTRSYLMQLASGQRQADVLESIINNWENVEKATDAALNSMGSSARENEVYMNSIKGKTKQLTSAFQKLAITTIDSGIVKGIVDISTATVKLVTNLGGLVPITLTLSGLRIATKASQIALGIDGVVKSLQLAKAAAVGTTTATTALGAATATALPWIGLLSVAIGAGAMAFNHFSKKAEEARQNVIDLESEMMSFERETSNLPALAQEFEQLSAKSREEQGLNNEEQQRFLDIQNKLKDIMPDVVGYYDEQNNFIITQTDSMSDLVEMQKEMLQNHRKEVADAAQKTLDISLKSYDKQKKAYKKLYEDMEFYRDKASEDKGFTDMLKQTEAEMGKLGAKSKELANQMSSDLLKVMRGTEDWSNLTTNQANAINRVVQEMDTDTIAKWASAIKDGTLSTEDLIEKLRDMPDTTEYAKDATESLGDTVEDTGKSFEATQEQIEAFAKSIKESAADITTLKDAVDELDEHHQLSQSTLSGLIESYPDLIFYIGDEVATREYLLSVIEMEKDAYHESAKALMLANYEKIESDNEYYNAKILGNAALIDKIKELYGVDLQNYSNLAEAKKDIEERLINAVGGAWGSYYSQNRKYLDGQIALMEQFAMQGAGSGVERGLASLKKYANTLDNMSFESVVVDFIAPSVDKFTAPKPKSSKKSSKKTDPKSSYPKYIEEGYAEIIKSIEKESDKVERVIDRTNKKIANAQMLGLKEEELELQKQLEEFMQQRQESEEKMSISFIDMRKKLVDTISAKGLKELKDINIEAITELQLADINKQLDKQIDIANTKKDNKLSVSLSNRKAMINEYANAIMKANENINSIATSWWDRENERIEQSIALVKRKHELEIDIITDRNKSREIDMLLARDGSDEMLKLEEEKYNDILKMQETHVKYLKEIKEKGLDVDANTIREYKDMYYAAEKERLAMLRSFGEKEKQLKLDRLRQQSDDLVKSQEGIQELLSMTIQMLRQQYEEERQMLQDNMREKEEAFRKEDDAYRRLIERRKQALRDEQEERNYNKGLKEREKKIRETEDRIELLKLDKSNKTQVEILKLEEELAKYREDMEEYQYEHSITQQEKLLDEELDRYLSAREKELKAYLDQKNEELKIIDEHLSKEKNLREEAIKLIEGKSRDYYNNLMKWNDEYGDSLSTTVDDAWNAAYNAMDKYNDGQLNVLGTLRNITNELQNVQREMERVERSQWQDYVSDDRIRPKDRDIVESGGGSSTSSKDTTTSSKPAYTEREAREAIQENQQRYLHNQARQAKDTGDMHLLRWVQGERKRWGMNPETGAIDTVGLIPDEAWRKYKKQYGFYRGGETSMTGLHWLDGEPGKPERVLSYEQNRDFTRLTDNAISFNEKMEKVLGMAGGTGDIQIGELVKIIIEGNATDDMLDQFKDETMALSDRVIKDLSDIVYGRGLK